MVKRILVVDDNYLLSELFHELLEKAGYEVIGRAQDGKIAIEMFLEYRPDLVLMDGDMPVMDGFKATFEIKKLDSSSKILMISGGGNGYKYKAEEAGADAFVDKPIRQEELIEVVRSLIGDPGE